MEMTIRSMFELNANRYPDFESVIFEDARSTYSEIRDRANQRAGALLSLGVKQGEHVAVMASNCMELVESVLAIWQIGAVFVPLNFRLSPNELTYLGNHSDAETIIFLDSFEETVREIKPTVKNFKRYLFIGERPPNDFIDFESSTREQSTRAPSIEVKEEDVATILYTAGTTGKPKGVVSTHKKWVWASMAVRMLREGFLLPDTKTLLSGPYFHAGGIGNFLFCFLNGSPQVVLKKFDPRDVLEWIEKEKINRLQGVATLYNMILQVDDIDRYDLSSIHTVGSGAETMPDETRNRLKNAFPDAGITEGYGMTESCGIISARPAEYTDTKPYSVGVPPPIIEVRVVDEKGRDIAPNEVGEIITRGPNMMVEYYKDPEKTADALRDGWLYTHDLGRLDEDGFLYIIERKNDMIKSGGENIYPKEVEDVLFRHPKIAEAAVFGIPDKIWGENVNAAVVLQKDEQMTAEEVIEFCKENLASFKKPKAVKFIDALPRSTVGKVLRSELKKRFKDE
jgi:acyl-CoA synthetase (AMP-forming)/AMP-acid ligase II